MELRLVLFDRVYIKYLYDKPTATTAKMSSVDG